MHDESAEARQKLRTGFTTGACATVTALAAAQLLLTDKAVSHATITLPKGQNVEFKLETCECISQSRATASTIKDAGDDPDATHKATIFSEIELSPTPGVRFHAAQGVGTVTRAGLSIGVGEPAINPVPRKMITEHLQNLADSADYRGGFEVHVGVVDGEKIALKTMNARLGILGGVSILGTTGIVRPFSCAAYIASIHQSIDVAYANNISHIAASTGSTSETYIQNHLSLSDMALVEMGDFAGAVLKHLRKIPINKLSICGGFGKMSKMAAGHHALHSHDSSISFDFLAQTASDLGADSRLSDKITQANTSLEALDFCQRANIPLANKICKLAKHTALGVVKKQMEIDVYSINKSGQCVGTSLSASE